MRKLKRGFIVVLSAMLCAGLLSGCFNVGQSAAGAQSAAVAAGR